MKNAKTAREILFNLVYDVEGSSIHNKGVTNKPLAELREMVEGLKKNKCSSPICTDGEVDRCGNCFECMNDQIIDKVLDKFE